MTQPAEDLSFCFVKNRRKVGNSKQSEILQGYFVTGQAIGKK